MSACEVVVSAVIIVVRPDRERESEKDGSIARWCE